MKFSAERTQLLEIVTKMQRVVGAKTSMPVLEGILISAEKGKITLISYNLEMGMKKELYANCEEEGDIVIGARLLAEILRKMNGMQVEISADERLNCTIKSGEASFQIMGMAATDFPEMPGVEEGNHLSLDGAVLADMIKGTIFSTAQGENAKPILTGILVTVENGTIRLVAVDGFRLAIRKEKIDLNEFFSFIVSAKAFGEVLKLIDENAETVEIHAGTRLISFEIGGYHFISRLLEGEFVNFAKVIPEGFTQRIVVNTRDLINTIERVSLLITEFFSTPVRCYFNEHSVVFTSATSVGRATETFSVELEGENFEIGLNSRHILEALRAAESERVEILFNGARSGIVINPVDGDEFQYMTMPMRLK